MIVVVTFRSKDDTEVVGTYRSHKKAVAGAVKHLKGLGVDEDDLDGNTWEQAVERWCHLSDGYEEFSFKEQRVE